MTDEDKIRTAIKASELMIAESRQKVQEAVEREDWGIAGLQSAYLDGMEQILVVFKVHLDWYNRTRKE